ncbi:MAG: AI-2E family transporter [Parcubacteria group bacterium]|jgi:predicted PurR-regulated permease PerM|nr:AI-2E family transporter [Parcubacteria group bacterium]
MAIRRSSEKMIQISTGTIIKALLVILIFGAIYYLRDIALVVVLSIVIASAVEPGTQWFLRRKVPRVLAVLLIYSIVILILVGAFYFLFLPILNQSSSLLSSLPGYLGELQVWNPLQNSSFFSSNPTIQGFSETFSLSQIVEQINSAISSYSEGFFSTASTIFGGILSFILVIVLSFYLSVEPEGISGFLRIITPAKNEEYVLSLWKRSQRKIGLWMQGQIVLVVIVSMLVFLGLTLLRVENALILAMLAGAFEIIPIFGPILAAIPAVILALVSDGMTSAILVIGLYIIIQQFENQLIYPLVVRKIVGVPPLVSILALIIGAKLAGFVGVLISVPLAAMLMEFLNDIEKDKIAEVERLKIAKQK